MRRLEKDDPDAVARIADYRRIIAFRNVLIHGYDVIDPAILWSAIADDLAPFPKGCSDQRGLTPRGCVRKNYRALETARCCQYAVKLS